MRVYLSVLMVVYSVFTTCSHIINHPTRELQTDREAGICMSARLLSFCLLGKCRSVYSQRVQRKHSVTKYTHTHRLETWILMDITCCWPGENVHSTCKHGVSPGDQVACCSPACWMR